MSYLNEKWFMYIYDNSCRKIDEDKNNSEKVRKHDLYSDNSARRTNLTLERKYPVN